MKDGFHHEHTKSKPPYNHDFMTMSEKQIKDNKNESDQKYNFIFGCGSIVDYISRICMETFILHHMSHPSFTIFPKKKQMNGKCLGERNNE